MFFVIPTRKNVNAKEIIPLKLVRMKNQINHLHTSAINCCHFRFHFKHFSIPQFFSFSLVMPCNIFFRCDENSKVLETAVQNVSVADDLIIAYMYMRATMWKVAEIITHFMVYSLYFNFQNSPTTGWTMFLRRIMLTQWWKFSMPANKSQCDLWV